MSCRTVRLLSPAEVAALRAEVSARLAALDASPWGLPAFPDAPEGLAAVAWDTVRGRTAQGNNPRRKVTP